MKRINTTRLMAVLASLCLVTSSFVGSTLAKYITTANSNDAARVAKFGVVLQADGNLFGQNYVDDISMDTDAAALAVQSHYDMMNPVSNPAVYDDVIAPGTKNEDGLHFSVNGTPEVATKLNAQITVENVSLGDMSLDGVNNNPKNGIHVMVYAPTVTDNSFKSAYDTTDSNTLGCHYYFDGEKFVSPQNYIADKEYYTLSGPNSRIGTMRYYPIDFKVTGSTGYTNTATGNNKIQIDSANAVASLYANKLAGIDNANVAVPGTVTTTKDGYKTTYTVEAEYPPNFDYSSLGVDNETLTWEWPLESGVDINGFDSTLGDLVAMDPATGKLPDGSVMVIGNWSAGQATYTPGVPEEYYNLTAGFDIEITVTQLDDIANKPANN